MVQRILRPFFSRSPEEAGKPKDNQIKEFNKKLSQAGDD